MFERQAYSACAQLRACTRTPIRSQHVEVWEGRQEGGGVEGEGWRVRVAEGWGAAGRRCWHLKAPPCFEMSRQVHVQVATGAGVGKQRVNAGVAAHQMSAV
eukprot:365610-Chlamydomonas_euryale.AAC.1